MGNDFFRLVLGVMLVVVSVLMLFLFFDVFIYFLFLNKRLEFFKSYFNG